MGRWVRSQLKHNDLRCLGGNLGYAQLCLCSRIFSNHIPACLFMLSDDDWVTRESALQSKWLWEDNLIIPEVWRHPVSWKEQVVWREGRPRHFGNIKTNNTTLTLIPFVAPHNTSPPWNKKGLKQKSASCPFTQILPRLGGRAAAEAQRVLTRLQRGWSGECERDPGRSALDCCRLIHNLRRREGSEPSTEASHWTSAKGCVNAFSRPLHITGGPPSGSGRSRLNLWPGQRLRLPGRRIAFANGMGVRQDGNAPRGPEMFCQVRTEKRTSPAASAGGLFAQGVNVRDSHLPGFVQPKVPGFTSLPRNYQRGRAEVSRRGRTGATFSVWASLWRPVIFFIHRRLFLYVKAAQSSSPFCFQSKLAAVSRRKLVFLSQK